MTTPVTLNIALKMPNFNDSPWHDELNENFANIDALFRSVLGLSALLGEYQNSTAVTEGQRYYDATTGTYYEAQSDFTTMAAPNTFATERSTYPLRWSQLDAQQALDAASNAAASETAAAASASAASDYADAAAASASTATTQASTATTQAGIATAQAVLAAAAKTAAEAAQVAAEAAVATVTPMEDQINAASSVAFSTADEFGAYQDGTGDLIKQTWAEIVSALGDTFYTETEADALLAAKAPLASPTFTGTPLAPTQTPGTNTTSIATTAFVQAAVAALVDSSPGALDTLNELAAALGDDANFASTMTTALAGKQPLSSELTALAALTGTAYGRALLEVADQAALQSIVNVENNADVTDAANVSSAGASMVSSGAGAPGTTPAKIGNLYVDTTNDVLYVAKGTASSADWIAAGGADAVQVITGEYTGDDAGTYQISGLGIQPKFVILTIDAGNHNTYLASDIMITNDRVYQWNSSDTHEVLTSASSVVSLDADGFTVGGTAAFNDPNGGSTFQFIAIGS